MAPKAGSRRIVEVGCGAGNTVFPLLRLNENPQLEIFACDYSARAVEVVKVAYFVALISGLISHARIVGFTILFTADGLDPCCRVGSR